MKHSLLYHLLRPAVKVSLGLYFRNLHIIDEHLVPEDGPLLIASNHPNSFAEPVILATYQKRILYFLVRGDVFKNPFFAWLLRMTHQLPIYRFKDGYADMKRNDESFSACYDHLNRENSIVIYAEGGCVFEKRLRSIKKGAARIVLGALEKYPDIPDIKILPVGVNYPHGDEYRSQAMVHFGEPISVREYWALYQEQPQVAINQITLEIERRLSPLVIQVREKESDTLYDGLMDLWHAANPVPVWPVKIESEARLQTEHRLSDFVNGLEGEALISMQHKITQLRENFRQAGLRNWSKLYLRKKSVFTFLIVQILLCIPALAGILLNFIPFYFGKWVAPKSPNAIEFYTPVRVGSMFLMACLQNLVLTVLTISYQEFDLLAGLVFYPLWSWVAAYWIENWEGIVIHFKYLRLTHSAKQDYADLLDQIDNITKTPVTQN